MQDRTLSIGGSDAVKLYTYEKWTDLWLEKTKAAEPVDLSDNFKVQLGTYTEAFNRYWFCKKRKAKGKEHVLEHPVLPPFNDEVCNAPLSANLDGYLPEENAVVEFKHTFEGNNLVELERVYYPQLQHYMYCMGSHCKHAYLVAIFGNSRQTSKKVKRDQKFINEELLPMYKDFWYLVKNKIKPCSG